MCALAACSPRPQGGANPRPFVNPALLAEVADPAALARVSSVVIAPVTVDGRAQIESTNAARPLFDEVTSAIGGQMNAELFADPRQYSVHDFQSREGARRAYQIASEKRATAVLLTDVHRYVERDGSRLGANEPAEIGFTMTLSDTATRQPLWKASYFYRDQPLSENLLRLPQQVKNPGWQSAHALLIEGLKVAARDLAERRSNAFSVRGGR